MRRNRTASILAVLLVSCAILLSSSTAIAGDQDGRYFSETRHHVNGPFWDYYQNLDFASLMLGFPITEAEFDGLTQSTIQYFQRGRLEYRPEAPLGQQVTRTPLGEYLLLAADDPQPLKIQGLCHREPHWNYPVCGDFLAYFKRHGGEAAFGLPISGFLREHGRTVQYFTYSRIEYQPDAFDKPPFTLGDLGRSYFELKREDPIKMLPVPENNLPGNLISGLRVSAFPGKAIADRNSLQSLYIIVDDQSGLDMPNATVKVTITFPDGSTLEFTTETDIHGVATVPFRVDSLNSGQAQILISAYHIAEDQVTGATSTFFRVR
jgi:hypothetical protein